MFRSGRDPAKPAAHMSHRTDTPEDSERDTRLASSRGLERERDDLRKRNAEAAELLRDCAAQLEAARRDAALGASRRAQLEARLAAKDEQLARLQVRHAAQQKTIEELGGRAEAGAAERAELTASLAAARKSESSLQNDLVDRERALATKQEDLDALSARHVEATARCEELLARSTVLEQHLETAGQRHAGLEASRAPASPPPTASEEDLFTVLSSAPEESLSTMPPAMVAAALLYRTVRDLERRMALVRSFILQKKWDVRLAAETETLEDALRCLLAAPAADGRTRFRTHCVKVVMRYTEAIGWLWRGACQSAIEAHMKAFAPATIESQAPKPLLGNAKAAQWDCYVQRHRDWNIAALFEMVEIPVKECFALARPSP
jgi:hypothetical protein